MLHLPLSRHRVVADLDPHVLSKGLLVTQSLKSVMHVIFEIAQACDLDVVWAVCWLVRVVAHLVVVS